MCAQRNEAVHRKQTSNGYFIDLIGLIICIGAFVSVLMIVLALANLGMDLRSKPIIIAIIIDAGLVALPFFLIKSGKSGANIVLRFGCIAIAALMLFLNIFANTYLSATSDFFSGMAGSSSVGQIEYSIVAQKAAGIDLDNSQGLRAGIQSTDTAKDEAEDQAMKLADASFEEYSDMSSLIAATEDGSLDIAVVQNVMLTIFAESFKNSYANLEVLTTFSAGSEAAGSGDVGASIDITKPFSIYVSGADTQGDIDQVSRSDVNMLALIDPENYKILLINTPRDYYVRLHDTEGLRDKLTHSGIYGMDMSEMTMEDLYGIDINYRVRINYDTVINLVDSMGGINVDNPTPFWLWGTGFGEGNIYLNGYNAMLYCRARKEDTGLTGGDATRGENQQRVIEGIIDRITQPHIVILYKDILNALTGTFRTNIPGSVISQLFSRQISMGGDWTIERMSATGATEYHPTYSIGDRELDVMIPDEESLNGIRLAIADFMKGSSN